MFPQVTIITVNFNNRKGLEETILSVSKQTYKNFEHIIIDGGSTDGSVEIIAKYRKNFSFSVSEADNGIYDAMNKGIRHAKGKYCMFLNSGDLFYEKKVLDKIFSKSRDSDIIYGDVVLSYDKGSIEKKRYPKQIDKCFLVFETVCHQSTIYRTSYLSQLGGYDLNYKICADYAILVSSVCSNIELEHVPIFISTYDMTGTANNPQNFNQIMDERAAIQSKYYTKQEIEISLKAEPIYRDWLKWRQNNFLEFYEVWTGRINYFADSFKIFFSLNMIKKIILRSIFFAIRKLGLFNEKFYQDQLLKSNIDLPEGSDKLQHYFHHGYFAYLEPNKDFNGSLVSKYFDLRNKRIKNPLFFLILTFKIRPLFISNILYIEEKLDKKKYHSNWKEIIDSFKKLSLQTRDKACHFIFNHNLGGGSLKALDLILDRYIFKKDVILISPSTEFRDLIVFEFISLQKKIFLKQAHLGILFQHLIKESISLDIRINHLLGFEGIADFLKEHLNLVKDIFLHDYYLICPFLFLSPREVYCGLPSIGGCNACLQKNNHSEIKIESYRERFEFLFQTDFINIIAPSESVISHFKKVFPLAKYSIKPHENTNIPPAIPVIKKEGDTFRVIVLGHLTIHKGVELVNFFVEHLKKKNLKIKVICIGFSEPRIPISEFYEETGPYKEDELEKLLLENNPDLIWFPVRIPETYSFTLTKALTSCLPLYIPDIGAFPERTEGREYTLKFSSSEELLSICQRLIDSIENGFFSSSNKM